MSEFDLKVTHVPGKANIIADALSYHADLDPTRVAAVSVSIESDLLAAIRLAQEQDSLNTFCDLKYHAIANDRGMYMYNRLLYHTSHTRGQTIMIPDDKALK